ncbi:MAG: hypothetical protein M3256_13700, partial [Actinomycetota bacterium]|nr:hypothetical protein [Actinomycetota bacterium]
PLALYYYWLFHAQPIWRTSGVAVAATASPLVYLLAFGPLALLALAALPLAAPPIRRVRSGEAGRGLVDVLVATGRLQLVFGFLLAAGIAL